ncbi:MAG TPA: carboxypeptidase regulatory-like domain-containing protein, partial [Polyangiales bacterium]|nr:carboxypeptidase regulatory-like domain-containing protein [Polyangiales bacterium]
GGSVDDLRIVLGTGGRLVGRVVDGMRRPLSEIRVGVTQSGEATRWIASDDQGGFEFDALSGRCTLVAAPAMGAATQLDVDVPAGGVKRIDIIVDSARGRLFGRVFDTDGEPVARALIKVDAGDARGQLPVSVLSTADGTFAIEGVPEPPFVVRVEHADYARGVSARVSELGKALQLVLEAGEVLEGRVIDAASSEGLTGARLTLQRGALVERVKSDRTGKFAFQRVARGTYQLWAEAEGHLTLTRTLEVSGPQRDELELVLELAGSLSGEIVDRIGSPVWNAEVAAGEPPDWSRATRSDHAGHFVLEGLAPGGTAVSARKGGVSGVSSEVRVHEGVDSPGVVVRLEAVVRAEEEPDEEPARRQEVASAQTAEGAVPLVLGRKGDSVIVERVAAGSSAERIGLQVGDVVSAINGEAVRSPAQARGMLGLGSPRGWVIDVRRGGEVLRLRYLAR